MNSVWSSSKLIFIHSAGIDGVASNYCYSRHCRYMSEQVNLFFMDLIFQWKERT